MPNEIIGKILAVALSTWAFSAGIFWLYFMYGVFVSWRSSAALLQQVREASQETFDYLHSGTINSAFGVLPYITINGARFNAFVKSEQLNEYSNIKSAKVEWIRACTPLKRNLIIWVSLMGVGFIIMIIGLILITTGVLNSN